MTSAAKSIVVSARSKDVDWSGQWFQLLQDLGEDVAIRVGVVDDNEGGEFAERSHVEFDGLGAVVDVLAGRGVVAAVDDGRVAAVSALRAWATALRFATDVPKHVDWWPRQPTDPAQTTTPTSMAPQTTTRLLTPAHTTALVQRARDEGGTLTTLLLARLATAVAPSLSTPQDPQPWMVPVNLRGQVTTRSPLANSVGFLTLVQTTNSTASSTKAALQAAASSGEAQATWRLNQIGRLVGRRGMRRILQTATSSGYKNVGNFSNLGMVKVSDPRDVRGVHFVPPVARSQSCAVGVVTVAGRLSIGVALHPTVRVSRDVVKQWLDVVVDA